MKKYILAVLLGSLSSIALAANPDCSKPEDIGQDETKLEACLTSTNDKLNGTYKELRDIHKDNEEKLGVLKDMQLGWIKMRDAQCLFRSMNSAGGGGAALTAVLCEIELTNQRAKELADL